MANVVYDNAKKNLLNGVLGDLSTRTIKCALVTSTYTPAQTTDQYFSAVTNEVTGTGYTAGGATLGSVTVTADTTNHRGVIDAADTAWTSSTITARGAVVYYSTGTASTSPLLAYIDFGSDYTSSSGTFTITWNAAGVFYIG